MKRVRLKAMHATEINLSSSWHVCFGEKWKEDGNYQTNTGLDPKVQHKCIKCAAANGCNNNTEIHLS